MRERDVNKIEMDRQKEDEVDIQRDGDVERIMTHREPPAQLHSDTQACSVSLASGGRVTKVLPV